MMISAEAAMRERHKQARKAIEEAGRAQRLKEVNEARAKHEESVKAMLREEAAEREAEKVMAQKGWESAAEKEPPPVKPFDRQKALDWVWVPDRFKALVRTIIDTVCREHSLTDFDLSALQSRANSYKASVRGRREAAYLISTLTTMDHATIARLFLTESSTIRRRVQSQERLLLNIVASNGLDGMLPMLREARLYDKLRVPVE